MNYIQYMKPGSKFWALPNGQEDVSWSEFWNNWNKAIAKAKEQIVDNWKNLKQDYKDAADPIATSERKQAKSIEATRAKQASMKFVSDNRTDYEKKRDRKNFELKEFEQKEQQNKDATDAVMWTLTGIPYAVQHLASPNGVVKTYGNTKAAIQNGGGPYIEKAVVSAAGDVLDASIVGVPLWNAARPYAVGLYNTTNYSSLGNRLAHPIESLRFAKINTKLSDLVRRAYPEETAKLMLEEASPLFKTVRYYNKETSGPQYIGGTDVPLQIEGLRNTPSTTVKMWDRAHEYGHLFDDALRRLDIGMARGNFGLSKEGISLVPKNYTYSPGVGINTPRGQMEFMADNIASSLYPEPKHVGMLHGEVAPYLERQALAAQVPFGSMYVQNGRAHVPYFLPEYKNFGRFIPTSAQRGSLGKGYKLNAQDGHSILLDTEIKSQTIPTKTSLAFFERQPAKISKGERLGIPKGQERTIINNEKEILNNAKSFAEKYGYEIPETIDAAKAMYNQHNSFFRTPSNHESVILHYDPELAKLPLEQQYFKLASKGYPESMRSYDFSQNGIYNDDFVFVAPDYGEVMPYINDVPAVMLRRPFRKSNPLTWHKDAEWTIQSKYTPYDQVFGKNKIGTAQIGNAGPQHEFKVSTRYLQPVKIAEPADKGTLLGIHLGPYEYKSGGTIKIKKKNLGSFTRYCNGKVTEECIRKGKNSSNPTTRKRANFAWVARHKFKHEEGGKLNYLNYFN